MAARCFIELSDEQLATLGRGTELKGPAVHSSFGRNTAIGGSRGVLRGLIGIHDSRASGKAPEPSEAGIVLHYSFELEKDVTTKDAQADDWDRLSEAVSGVVGSHQVIVSMWAVRAKDEIVPATALPIALGDTGVSGFSEIRGVRLAQPDPSDKDNDLYSVVLDKEGNEYFVTASTSIEATGLEEELLRRALDRLKEVAMLAYKEAK